MSTLAVAVGMANAMHRTMPATTLPYPHERPPFAWECWYYGQLEGLFGRRNGRWHYSEMSLRRAS